MNLLAEFLRLYVNKEVNCYIEKFLEYEKILLDWNERVNLISRKQKGIEKIILDSIFFLSDYKLRGDETAVDIGTGGGFPGIPLKIIYPNLKITLVDSINKKTKALTDIVNKLKLEEVNVVCARAEDLCKKSQYKFKYDIVTSKAVSELVNLYKWSRDFLKTDGKMICIKGGDINEELKSFQKKYPEQKFEIRNYNMKSLLPNYNLSFGEANNFSEKENLKSIIIIYRNEV